MSVPANHNLNPKINPVTIIRIRYWLLYGSVLQIVRDGHLKANITVTLAIAVNTRSLAITLR